MTNLLTETFVSEAGSYDVAEVMLTFVDDGDYEFVGGGNAVNSY